MESTVPARTIRWGILGTGRAAADFARGLRYAKGAELAAVASRTTGKAERFISSRGAHRACNSYDELLADPAIDVVYVATPSFLHRTHSLLALDAGKAVLCEKPFAVNAAEAQEVIALAHKRQLFCMEAMWMHFLPGMQEAIRLVETGAIGRPLMLMADFGIPTRIDPEDRTFNPALGGGAMLERGVYPLALAQRLFGFPAHVQAMATSSSSSVDELSSVMLRYPEGQIAMVAATLTAYATNEAVVMGTEGRIAIREPLCRPDHLTLTRAPAPGSHERTLRRLDVKERLRSTRWVRGFRRIFPGRAKTMYVPYVGNGYNYEASEVMRCLRAGAFESPVWPLRQTEDVMRTLDLIRNLRSA